ncbi:hypothetical protein [Nocardia sp. NPDC052566]|uniref:hypothetical protein n=1 Tax=Nocardia sp. NPDC052566 TaxID=3364330 RepID=UPI0037CBC7FC
MPLAPATQQLGPKADRISAMRKLIYCATPTQARQLLCAAKEYASHQQIAFSALEQTLTDAYRVGYARETRPRAFSEHDRTVRAAQIAGRFPWGAERAVVYASAAVLFEAEANRIGSQIRPTLLRPVLMILGPEHCWIGHANTLIPV